MIEFNFEKQMINKKEEIVLCLLDFPDVKFMIKSIKLGSIDDEQQIPVMFEIDLIDENQTFPEDPKFGSQVSQVMLELLVKMTNHSFKIINSIN